MSSRAAPAGTPPPVDEATVPAEGWVDPNPPTTQVPEQEHPVQDWMCENPRCRFFQQERRVHLQHLGQGLYLTGPVRCECGRLVVRVRAAGAKVQ